MSSFKNLNLRYFTLILLLLSLQLYSQKEEIKEITSYPNSILQFNWTYNSFIDLPEDMDVSPLSMGTDIYFMQTILGKKSCISLVLGGGLSVQNIKSNSYFQSSSDSSYFVPLSKDLSYKKNKITTVFFDLPLEIRLRTRPKSRDKAGIVRKRNFRMAIGAKLGYNIQRYVKYDGEDYHSYNYGNQIKFKEYRLSHLLRYRYGVYTNIGIGNFSLYAYYSLTKYIEDNSGPELTPFSIGLSVNI